MDYQLKLGVAPTRRFIFSKGDAFKFKGLTLEKLGELGIDYVDIDDINTEGLLHSQEDVSKIINKFKAEKVDAVFFPHVNFGTEDIVCKVAKALGVPVVIWGPRDEAPLPDGSRLRDTQCGLFATGKVMRRMNIPFTYIPNCTLDDVEFGRGMLNFIAAAYVVKEFRKLKVLQLSTRPQDFWTTMCNEGELLEKFNIQILPKPMPEMVDAVTALEATDDPELLKTVDYINNSMKVDVTQEKVKRLAALKCVMKQIAEQNECNAIAIQCWTQLQNQLQIHPCIANAMLTEEGIPVACETDIHGAISSVIIQAAAFGVTPSFFVDWSVRHPDNPNGELLQHCGPWPLSLAKKKPMLGGPFAFEDHFAGAVHAELKDGDMTILRFDADHGDYSVLCGTARSVEGPRTAGTYKWVEVDDWPALEEKIVKGPYIHHASAVHGNVMPVIYEACNLLGLKIDFFYNYMEKEVKDYLRGR